MSKTKTIELGDVVKDEVTGFEGVVIAHTRWLHGCDRMTVQPQALKDGKPIDACSFDVQQLDLVKKAAVSVTPPAQPGKPKTGGPRPEPVRR